MLKRKTKRRDLTSSEFLVSNLWLESVIIQTPSPFGSFEKAKYVILKHGEPVYWFTTTCRNTEDCIEIMKAKFKAGITQTRYCNIYKEQNGIREKIYTDQPTWML